MNLSAKDRTMIYRAQMVAATSNHRFQHGAIITDHGKVRAVGVNFARNDPRNVEIPDSSVHAEIAALNSIRGNSQGLTLYVARQRKNGDAAQSKPCVSCQQKIEKAGIKRVVYTTDEQFTYGVWYPRMVG
jgi:deoxycytidylate deaminase